MDRKRIRTFGIGVLVAVWAGLTMLAWLLPDQQMSLSERRELAQMPEMEWESVENGRFMQAFESYTLDQFPGRETFRSIKALVSRYVLGQKDNSGIYIADGSAAQQEYPLNQESLDYAAKRFAHIYETYLKDTDCRTYMAIIPDKGYYLSQSSGQLAMDYEAMFSHFRQTLPWAEHIDLTHTLTAESYYRTDTHWRQEALTDAADLIAQTMGSTALSGDEAEPVAQETPFYGVYYGQAALPLQPDTMYLLESSLLDSCVTYLGQWDTSGMVFQKAYNGVYDRDKLDSRDPYEVFLSGSQSLVRIENPNAGTQRELVIFRDSFGSALAPLLVPDYAAVTLVDIRYLNSDRLRWCLDFEEQDVLLLYSTLVLNNSTTLK